MIKLFSFYIQFNPAIKQYIVFSNYDGILDLLHFM